MHTALTRVDHRPWPLPSGRWAWRQSWCDLLFAHWPIPAAALQPLVPAPLRVHETDGTSWIGVVPFRMEGVMRRPLPDLPGISAFPECNLRIYVDLDGKPGVWFLSLDATNALAVWAARRFFHLPYFKAEISMEPSGEARRYTTRRRAAPDVGLRASYSPSSDFFEALPGSLEAWLTERYCLYAQAPNGALFRTEVHHHPWSLQRAEADFESNTLLAPHGLETPEAPPLLHFARRIDVVVWPPERVGISF